MDDNHAINGFWDDTSRSFYVDTVRVHLEGPLRDTFDRIEDAKHTLSSVVENFTRLWEKKIPSRVLQSITIEYYSSLRNAYAPRYVIHTVLPTPKGKMSIRMYQEYKTIKERGVPRLVLINTPQHICFLVTYAKNTWRNNKCERLYPASLLGMFTSLDSKVRKIYARDLKSDFHRRAF